MNEMKLLHLIQKTIACSVGILCLLFLSGCESSKPSFIKPDEHPASPVIDIPSYDSKTSPPAQEKTGEGIQIPVKKKVIAPKLKTTKTPSENKPPVVPTNKFQDTTHAQYEILLPEDYSPKKKYNLLFCLHPAGNGKEYVNYLKPMAKGNLIIAGSNGYKNGISHTIFLPSIEFSIKDIKRNQNISSVYLCGFSGGGMASYVAAYFKPGSYAGVISNDGLIHNFMQTPEAFMQTRLSKVVIFSGNQDEVVTSKQLQDNKMMIEQAGVETNFMTFSGGHQFAPVKYYEKAIQWLNCR